MQAATKYLKNYDLRIKFHQSDCGILCLELTDRKPDAQVWSFSSDWHLVFSSIDKRVMVAEADLKERLGYPFKECLGSITKAVFQEEFLVVATQCGHLVVFDCVVGFG